MKKVIIKANSWIARIAAAQLRAQSVAIVIGHTIYLHNVAAATFMNNRRWLLHELMHVHQFQRYGAAQFLLLYLIEHLKNGYRNNKYEIEARMAETDDTLLEKYAISSY